MTLNVANVAYNVIYFITMVMVLTTNIMVNFIAFISEIDVIVELCYSCEQMFNYDIN